ncbi:MAG: type IV pilus assembly protein PilM [Clostridia bacterium]|nr:type IV pilus assembly protein PilM [Clostridia bacterium]
MFRKRYVSIDIGNKNIKMVHGGLEKEKLSVYWYEIIPTPENAIKDGKIIQLQSITNTIKEVLKKNKIREKRMILNITGTGVITRDIQIPKSTDDEIEKILEYEAQQYFPVALENYVLDYKVQEEIQSMEGNLIRVLLVAVPVNQVEEYMKLPKSLRMEMEAIDLPANCVCKLLFGKDDTQKKAENWDSTGEFAVLDIGADTSGVNIFCDGKLKFSRILLNGSSDFDDALSKELGIDLTQAEEIKKAKIKVLSEDEEYVESSERISLCNIVRPSVNNIIMDVNRFFEFYNTRGTGNRIQKIYICGGGSKLLGMGNYLKSYFNIPVEYLACSEHIVYMGKHEKEFYADFIYLMNAIGALVR